MGLKEIWLSIIKKINSPEKTQSSPSSPKSFDEYEREYIENVEFGRDKSFDLYAMSIKDSTMENSRRFKNDLVCFHDYGTGCCGECAKYKGRVYSLSGESKVFPPLPEYARKNGNFHPGCRCTMSSYFDEGTVYFHNEKVDAVASSNRPYEDDRSAAEKQRYEDYLSRMYAEAKESAIREWDRDEYTIILEKLPDDAPKSFGAYRRMKNSNSAGFQKLQQKAAELGIKI